MTFKRTRIFWSRLEQMLKRGFKVKWGPCAPATCVKIKKSGTEHFLTGALLRTFSTLFMFTCTCITRACLYRNTHVCDWNNALKHTSMLQQIKNGKCYICNYQYIHYAGAIQIIVLPPPNPIVKWSPVVIIWPGGVDGGCSITTHGHFFM